MEEKLLVVGIIAFIYAKLSIFLQKKEVFKNKLYFVLWNTFFALSAGGLIYYILNFMAKNGIEGGLSPKTFGILMTATIAFAIYHTNKAKKADANATKKLYAFNLDWAETVYFAAFFAAFAMFFFMQAFQIPTASMRNTLIEGDNLFVNKITYGIRMPFLNKRLIKFNDIKRGDVIVFRFPADNKDQINCGGPQYGRDFVKRVVGMPGDIVEVNNQQVFINGQLQDPQPYEVYGDFEREKLLQLPLAQPEYQALWEQKHLEDFLGLYLRDYFGPITVPEGSYFAMGDNRDFSCDSRFWGPVPEQNIKGKAWFIHWPLNRMDIIK